jgi:hypothetical protein
MPITEVDRHELEASKKKEKIDYALDVIKRAAPYERLMVNKDFQIVLKDIKDTIKIHQEQIDGYQQQLITASIFKEMRILSVMKVHMIRKQQLEEAVSQPEKIIFHAAECREFLDSQKEGEQNAKR